MNSIDQVMAQMAQRGMELERQGMAKLQNGQIGDSLPGIASFRDVWNTINMIRDTANNIEANRRLREQQAELRGDGVKNNTAPQNGYTNSFVAPSVQNSWAKAFQNMPVATGDAYYVGDKSLLEGNANPFTEPTSEQAQRSVGDATQSATLDNFYGQYQPQQVYQQQDYPQQYQPQTVQPQQAQQYNAQNGPDYLSDQYSMPNFVNSAMANGGKTPWIQMMRYAMNYAPLREAARQERIRNNIAVWENPETTPEQKLQARIQLASDTGQLDLGWNLDQKRRKAELEERQFMATQGYMLSPEYDENVANSINDRIVDYALKNYEEGDQWMSPDGTGTSRTQCANLVTDIYKNIGLKGIGSSNGDVIAKQFADKGAYVKGTLAGIQPGDFLDFKDHVGIYIGNGRYMARNSTGGIHRGSMEEAIKWFGQPLGYGSVNKFAGIKKGQKYIKNPNYVSDREKLERQLSNDRWREAMANERLARQEARSDREFALKLAEFNEKYGNGSRRRRSRGSSGSGGRDKEMSYAEVLDAEKRIANGLTQETPDMSDEDKNKVITDKDIENIGRAWSDTADKYLEEKGENIEKAMEQFYYDRNKDAKNNPTTMNPQKLATSIASATAEALNVPVNDRYRFIKTATDYLLKYDEQLKYQNKERENQKTAWDKYLAEKQGTRSDNRRIQEETLNQKRNEKYNEVLNKELAERNIDRNSISGYLGTTAYMNKDEIDAFREAQAIAREEANKIK